MSWGFMPPFTGNTFICQRQISDKEPDMAGHDRAALTQLPSPCLTGFAGTKPGFPLGYEPDYVPQQIAAQPRYDLPCRGGWVGIVTITELLQPIEVPEGQDSTPPQQNAL